MADSRRTTEEIRREIEQLRENLAQDVIALEIEVRHQLDWRMRVRDRPLPYIGAAFGAGFVLGLLF